MNPPSCPDSPSCVEAGCREPVVDDLKEARKERDAARKERDEVRRELEMQDAARKERDEVRRELEMQEDRADFWKAENRRCEDMNEKLRAQVQDLQRRNEALQGRSDPLAQAQVIDRYQKCVHKILDMFPGDPLPTEDQAIERLESILRLGLIGPRSGLENQTGWKIKQEKIP